MCQGFAKKYDINGSSMNTPMVPPNKLGPDLNGKAINETQYRAMSSADAEYVATAGCYANTLWTKSQLTDYDIIYEKEEEVAEIVAKTIEQYMSKTRADYGSGVARPKIKDKDKFEIKGLFIKELRDNTFSDSDHEDANEYIEKVLEIMDLVYMLEGNMCLEV
nr:retrovirus-related Pol polyprotein from transposon TNT 1-94 [Tanacetum cinerariifolium]